MLTSIEMTKFQFHKGTIKTHDKAALVKLTPISIP